MDIHIVVRQKEDGGRGGGEGKFAVCAYGVAGVGGYLHTFGCCLMDHHTYVVARCQRGGLEVVGGTGGHALKG